jgi:SPP1 family predicted phage head-tail adaptor
MITGRMDRQITLMQPTTTYNDYGEPEDVFAAYGVPVFANVQQTGSREAYQAGKVVDIDVVFKIRYLSAVTEKWRVVYDDVTYEIVGRPKELGRQDGIEIMGRATE